MNGCRLRLPAGLNAPPPANHAIIRPMLWWHWFIFGLALLVADVALINVYFLLWFGLGAALVGGIVYALPDTSLTAQILLFTGASAAFLALWLLVLRPRRNQKLLELAKKELVGASGAVIRFAAGSGTLRLQKPVGGRDVWPFTSSAELRAGQTAVILSVGDDDVAAAVPSASAAKEKAAANDFSSSS